MLYDDGLYTHGVVINESEHILTCIHLLPDDYIVKVFRQGHIDD